MRNRFNMQVPARVVVLAASLSTLGVAQPAMTRVTFTHIRPDMASEWVDLQKNEVVPALKKAGQKGRTVYSSGLFGNSYEYVTITPMDNFAEFDAGNPLTKALGAAPSARLGEKLRKCTLSANSFQSTRMADLSNADPSNPWPKILVSTRVRVAPGKMPDFENLMKTDILPAYKKVKVVLTVNRRGLGANSNDVTISAGYSKYADLDAPNPVVKALGPDGAAKLLGKFTGVATLVEQVVRSRVDDLSF
jgi:hypothetical protein